MPVLVSLKYPCAPLAVLGPSAVDDRAWNRKERAPEEILNLPNLTISTDFATRSSSCKICKLAVLFEVRLQKKSRTISQDFAFHDPGT